MKLEENVETSAAPGDLHQLITCLREFFPADYEWVFCFYTAKKSRDGISLEFGRCEMSQINTLADSIKGTLLEKVLQERSTAPYTPFLPAEMIGVLAQEDELIRESLQEILYGVRHALPSDPEDFTNGLRPAPTGYILFGTQRENPPLGEEISEGEKSAPRQILFMRRSNPFIREGKNLLCAGEEGEIGLCRQAILRFAPAVDFILADGSGYFISPSVEKDFGLESRHIAIAGKRMELVAGAELVNNFEQLEIVAYTGKNARKFLTFDPEILQYIERISKEDKEEFLSQYGITVDFEGKVDADDPEQCELLIDLLCCRSCHDPLGRLAIANGMTPR